MHDFKYFSEKADKKPMTFQGYWHQQNEKEKRMRELRNQLFKLILWIIFCVICAGVMIPW